jgi:DNA-binding response OmpR family regulator
MGGKFTILLSDRNRHVLKFLERELVAEGYRVKVANEGREVLRMLVGEEPVDLLILDLELPYVDGLEILDHMRCRRPSLPVIIHTFHTEYVNHPATRCAAALVEKTGNHIDQFKNVIAEVLRRSYPDRFPGENEARAGSNARA